MTNAREQQAAHHYKHQLRQRMRALRRALPQDARAARSKAICEHIKDLEVFHSAKTIAAYIAIDGEVELDDLINTAWSTTKHVVLPCVEESNAALTFRSYVEGSTLISGAYDILTPPDSASKVDPRFIDLVIIPCTAVDTAGIRIGMGKGYYDRTLPTLNQALRCAVVYDFQRVSEIPQEEHDVRMDVVVSDRQVWPIKASVAP